MKKKINTNNLHLDLLSNKEKSQQFLDLQYETNSLFRTDVISITSVDNDEHAFSFAYNLAKSYLENKSKVLLIDANFYENSENIQEKFNDVNCIVSIDGVDAIKVFSDSFPGDYFRNKELHRLIEDSKQTYERFIVLVPSIKRHKEIGLLSDLIDCQYLVVEKNVTKKSDIFDAVEYCKENNIHLAKVIIFK